MASSDSLAVVHKVAEEDLPWYIEMVMGKFYPRSILVSFNSLAIAFQFNVYVRPLQ